MISKWIYGRSLTVDIKDNDIHEVYVTLNDINVCFMYCVRVQIL